MKKRFKLFLFFSVVLILAFSSFANAAPTPNQPLETMDCSNVDGTVSYQINKDGTVKKIIKVNNPKEFAKQNGLRYPDKIGEVTLVVPIISENTTNSSLTDANPLSPSLFASDLYVKVTSTSNACGAEVIRDSYYSPPGGTMTISQGLSATFSSSVSVNASVVTAGVGFDVAETFNVSDSQNISVPKGKRGEIIAHPIYLVKEFEVWSKGWFSDSLLGSGTAYKPIGVCFATYIF